MLENNLVENPIENRQTKEPVDIKDIRGSIQSVDSLPTFTPKTFYDSVVFYDSKLYLYDQNTQTWLPLNFSTNTVDSVNSQTGDVVLDQDDIGDGTTYKRYSQTEKSKLSNIEDSADVTDSTNVGNAIHSVSPKTTPADDDAIPTIDSEASNVLKKFTWSNIKAALKTYFDTLYASVATTNRTIGYDGTHYTYQLPFDSDDWVTNTDDSSNIHSHSCWSNAGYYISQVSDLLGSGKAVYKLYQDNKLYITFSAAFYGTGDAKVNYCLLGLTNSSSGNFNHTSGYHEIYLDFNNYGDFTLYFITSDSTNVTRTFVPPTGSFSYSDNNVYTIEYDYHNGTAKLYINGELAVTHATASGAYLPTTISDAYLSLYLKNGRVTLPTVSIEL